MSGKNKGESWDKRETIGRFVRDIAIVAVICVVGLALYKKKVDNDVAAHDLAKEASSLISRDNPADLELAATKLEAALAIRPKHAYALASSAEIHAILHAEHKMPGHEGKAREFLERAEKHAFNLPQTYSTRALLMLAEGKAKAAEDYLTENVIKKDAGDARIFAALALAQRGQGKLVEARRSARAASDSDWRNPRFSQIVGDGYLEEGDAANALAYYAKALGSSSEHLASQLGKARTQIRRGESLQEVAGVIEKALEAKVSPRLKAIALVAKAEQQLLEQKFDEALETTAQAASADPTYAWSYSVQASAKVGKEDVPGAAADYDKAIEADKHVASFYFDAANTMAMAGDGERAIGYLEKFGLKKDDRYFLHYGNVLRRLERFDEAIAKYDDAIKENELNAEAYVSKGAVLISQNKLDEAQDALDRAVAAQEFNPDAYVQRGRLLFAKKEFEAGVQEYAQALSQWKQGRAPREQLAMVIENVKQLLLDSKQRDFARAWETEASNLIR
jgi:tetratricopeptide (TPR) repeat protein